ncbi:MAG TPA: NAD-dependent epimerase/dehydratase family protein, partial [Candidatus Synoicihabitans sp.]|nr:NAD-dependent epimerase/dehydratase family protein [Candidatus Synoicihabitans sp.]
RALVTGAGGFVGRHLAATLGRLGWEVVSLGPRLSSRRHYTIDDVESTSAIAAGLEETQPAVVFHLAGRAPPASDEELQRVNVGYAAALRAAIRRCRPETRLLLMGSAAEYGVAAAAEGPLTEVTPAAPVSAYGRSKLEQTTDALAEVPSGLRVTVCRPFNILGLGMPRALALADWALQVREMRAGQRARVLRVGDLTTSRDFVMVDDVVQALVRLALSEAAIGEVVNIASERPTSLRSLLDRLLAAADLPVDVQVDPARLRGQDARCVIGSNHRLRALTGLAPGEIPDAFFRDLVGLTEGLANAAAPVEPTRP